MTISKTSSCLVNSPMYVGGWGLQKHVSQNSRLVSKTRLPDEGVISRIVRAQRMKQTLKRSFCMIFSIKEENPLDATPFVLKLT